MLQTILVFSPFLGALIAGLFGRRHRRPGLADHHLRPAWRVTALCAWINLFATYRRAGIQGQLLRWITVGSFQVDWALRVDSLSTMMMFVVGFISF